MRIIAFIEDSKVLIGIEEGAVENLRPAVAVAPDLSPQVAGRRRTKGEAFSLPHSLQKPGLILEKKEVLPAAAHRFLAGIHLPLNSSSRNSWWRLSNGVSISDSRCGCFWAIQERSLSAKLSA